MSFPKFAGLLYIFFEEMAVEAFCLFFNQVVSVLLPLSFLVFIQVIDKTIGLVGPEVKTL
jgi:hypothetical protein